MIALLLATGVSAQVPPYAEDFQAYGRGLRPSGWTDSRLGDLTSRPRVFETRMDPTQIRGGGQVVFGSTKPSIALRAADDAQGLQKATTPRSGYLSIYQPAVFLSMQPFQWTGRMIRMGSRARGGLTVLAGYPELDRYYLIAEQADGLERPTLRLSGWGAGTLNGRTNSNVTIESGQWYRFKIVVGDDGRSTTIVAKFWRDVDPEPADYSINALDSSPSRLRQGHIGVWSGASMVPARDDATPSSAGGEDDDEDWEKDKDAPPRRGVFVDDLRVVPHKDADAGNPPAIAITSHVEGALVAVPRVVVRGAVSGAVSVTINGVAAPISAGTFASPEITLLEGANAIVATATNAAGATATASLRITLDSREPALTIATPSADACLRSATVELSGSVVDPHLTALTVSLGQNTVPATLNAAKTQWTASIPLGDEGRKSVVVEAVDALGHRATRTLALVVDRVAPTIEVTEGGTPFVASFVNRSIAPFIRAIDVDPQTTLTARLDGAAYAPGTAIATEGLHAIVIAAVDCAGNRSERTISFTVDLTPPTIRNLSPANGGDVGSMPGSITGQTDSDVARVEISGMIVSATPATDGTFTLAGVPFVEGVNHFTIEAVDRAGNRGESAYSVRVNTSLPTIDIVENGTIIASGALFNRVVTPEIRVREDGMTVTATLNGALFTSGTPVVNDNNYTLVATATDAHSHRREKQVAFVVDRTPPVVDIISPTPGTMNLASVDVRVTAGDSESVIVNGALAVRAGDGSFMVRAMPLDFGENPIVATGSDRAGNSGSDSVMVMRDSAGPGILLSYPPDGLLTNRPAIDVAGRVITPVAASVVTIEVPPSAPVAAPVDVTGSFRLNGVVLREGENTIRVSARNNVAPASAGDPSVTVRVIADFTAPTVRILESSQLLGDGSRFPARAILTATATDNDQPVNAEVTVDGSTVALPATIDAIGGHTIIATARDAAGNETRVERSFLIGAAAAAEGCGLDGFDPPTGSVITSQTVTLVGRSGGAVGVKVNGVPATVSNGTFCATVELPAEGPNTVTIVCTDLTGAPVSGPGETITLNRSANLPSIEISSPAEGAVSITETIAVTGLGGAPAPSPALFDVNGVPATLTGGSFTVPAVRLQPGLNVIVARATAGGRSARASRRVLYLKTAPSISITSPVNNFIAGSTSIDVTGQWSNLDPTTLSLASPLSVAPPTSAALHSDTSGTFTFANIQLTSGEQTITITGRDRAGRQATASILITVASNVPTIAITEPLDNTYFGAGSAGEFPVRGTFSAAVGSTVEVNGVVATIDGASFTASIPHSATTTPAVARVTEPGGAGAFDTIRVTRLAEAPRVVEGFPAPNAAEVESGVLPLVLFSTPMERGSVLSAFRLESSNGTPVSGLIYLDRDVLTFAPATLLNPGERYSVRVTTGARDLAGNALVSDHSSEFTIASTAPSGAPSLASVGGRVCGQTMPVQGSAPAGARVRIEFGALTYTTTASSSGAFSFALPLSGASGYTALRVRTLGSDGSVSPAAEACVLVDCAGPQVISATYDRAANRITVAFSKDIKPPLASSLTLQLLDGRAVSNSVVPPTSAALVVLTPSEDLSEKSFTLTVGTTIEDLNGNRLSAAYSQLFSFAEELPQPGDGTGFMSGEVFDATTGRPLPGASITIEAPREAFSRTSRIESQSSVLSPQSSSVSSNTDARGRYASRLPEGAHTITATAPGYTTVWRQIIVPAGAGIVPIDIRLTKRGEALIHGGDTAVTRRVELRFGVAPPTPAALTAVGTQSLAGLLPLGWSPLASAEITGTFAAAELIFTVPADAITAATQTLTAVRYDDARDEWRVIAAAANVANGKVTIPITAAGAYALVYPDRRPGLASPPPVSNGGALQGVTAATSDPLTAVSFTLDPPAVLPTGRAVGTLKIEGAANTFPSGTAVQAYIDEDLKLADGTRVVDPPFATDLLLYRDLASSVGVAEFHLAPSAKASQVILESGFETVRILPYPGRLDRGTLVGPEGGRVPGDDKIAVEIPTGATAEPLHATATSITDLASFGSIPGFRIVGGFTLTLQRATPSTGSDGVAVGPVELSKSARATFSVGPPTPAAQQLILVEVLDDTPYGRLFRLAAQMTALDASRWTTKPIDRAQLPIDGVIREGRYLLLAAEQPIAFATGGVRAGATGPYVANAQVLSGAPAPSPALGASDLTRATGLFNIPVVSAPANPFALTPKHPAVGEGAPYTHPTSPAADAILNIGDLMLTPQAPVVTATIPSDGAKEVGLTTFVKVSFAPAIDPASIDQDSLIVTDASTGQRVSGTVSTEGTTAILWKLSPQSSTLSPNRGYVVTIAPAIRGTNGASFGRTQVFAFSTVTRIASLEVRSDRIRITIPDANGVSKIVGNAGALPTGWIALPIRRQRDFAIRHQVAATGDGSFTLPVGSAADPVRTSDLIDLQVINLAGAIAAIIPLTPFTFEDGRGFIAPADRPTRFVTPDGITVSVPAGAFDEPTTIAVNPSVKASFAEVPSFDKDLFYAASVKLDFEGVAKKALDIELAVPANHDNPNRRWLLGLLGESVRGPRVMIVDTLRIENGKFTTSEGTQSSVLSPQSSAARRLETNEVLTDADMKKYLNKVNRSGIYAVVDIHAGPPWSWSLLDGLQQSFDLFWNVLDSLYAAHYYTFERGRVAIPVLQGRPFTVTGVEVATGLEAFTRVYDAIAIGSGPVVIPPPQQNEAGPHPIFGSPFHVEVQEIDADTITAVRNFTLTRNTGGVLTITNTLAADTHIAALNVATGEFRDNNGNNTPPLRLQTERGQRVVLFIEERDIDPDTPLSVVFNESIYTGPSPDEEAIDAHLHTVLKLEQAGQTATGVAPSFNDITAQARFLLDSSNRRVRILLPSSLQRGGTFRVTLTKDIADRSGPGGGPGLGLAQATMLDPSGNRVPVGSAQTIQMQFKVRPPAGTLSSFCIRQSDDELAGGIRDLALDGNLLFVSAQDGGILVYDTADPAKLTDTVTDCDTLALSTAGPRPIGYVPAGATKHWAVSVDHHGRVYATGQTNLFGVLRTYRVEQFIPDLAANPPISKPAVVDAPFGPRGAKGATTVSWNVGASLGLGLASGVILSDRAEAIPRKVTVAVQDDEEEFADRAAFEAGSGATFITAHDAGSVRQYALDVALPLNYDYPSQRVTVQNETLDMRWSVDAPGTIQNIIVREFDRVRVLRNRTTYAVVSLFGHGVGVFDVNAIEANDSSTPPARPLKEQIALTNGNLVPPCADPTGYICPPVPMCDQAGYAGSGIRCPIRDLTFTPDAVVRQRDPLAPPPPGSTLPPAPANTIIYALDSTKGILDLELKPPIPTAPGAPANTLGGSIKRSTVGLVFAGRFGSQSEPHPRLEELKTRFAALNNGREPVGRYNSVSLYRWQLDGQFNRGIRGSAPGTTIHRDYAVVAGYQYGLLIVEVFGGDPEYTRHPLTDEDLADVIWIPGGAFAVRVIQGTNLATVVDGEGRILLVDLSNIDERYDATGAPTVGGFATVRKSLPPPTALPAPICQVCVGIDDPRILWKSEKGLVTGTLAPWIDAETGMLFAGELLAKKMKVVSALDPKVRVLLIDGKEVGSVVPMGIAPPNGAPASAGGLPTPLSTFRIEVALPGAMNESLPGNQLKVNIESERVIGALTEDTPVGWPKPHLRDYVMRRVVPNVTTLNDKLRRQKGFNRWTSEPIVALADPRAAEDYTWPAGANKAEKGCFACDRPTALAANPAVEEIWSAGRFFTIRPVALTGAYDAFDNSDRLRARVSTIMADTVRAPEVLVAAQNPPVADGMLQETTYLHSGELETSAVDLDAGGRAGWNVVFDRTYRSRTLGYTPLGMGWEAGMFKRVRALPNGNVEYRDGAGEIWTFRPNGDGTYTAPQGANLGLSKAERGYTLRDQKWRLTTFDDFGRLTSESDEFYDPTKPGSGNTIRYAYDDKGRLSTIIDPVERKSKLTYNSTSGLLQEIEDWRSRKITFTHTDTLLRRAEMPDVVNTSGSRPRVEYAYSGATGNYNDRIELSANLERITDPKEALGSGPPRVTFEHGTSGNHRDHVTTQRWATGESATLVYASATSAETVDALGQTRRYVLTAASLTDPFADRVHVSESHETNVNVWTPGFGQLPATAIPAGAPQLKTTERVRRFSHTNGMVTMAKLDEVRETTNGYQKPAGAPGRIIASSRTAPIGSSTSPFLPSVSPIDRVFNYQTAVSNGSTFLQSVAANGKTIVTPEPHRHNIQTTALNSSITAQEKFDDKGLFKETSSSGGTDTASAGSKATVDYFAADDPELHRRALPKVAKRGNDLETKITYPDQDTLVETDPRGVITTTSYDTWRRPKQVKVEKPGDPLVVDEQFTYDATGRLNSVVRRKGSDQVTTTYVYDTMGRRTSTSMNGVAVPGGTVGTSVSYDMPNRRMVTTHQGGATTTTTLDPLGRTIRTLTNTGSSPIEHQFAYDLDDNRVFQTDMQTASALAFDAHGRVLGTRYSDGTIATTEHDEWDRPKTAKQLDENAATTVGQTDYQFTDSGKLTDVTTKVDSGIDRATTFAWDGGGRTTSVATSGRAQKSRFELGGKMLGHAAGAGNIAALTEIFSRTEVTNHDGDLPSTTTSNEKMGSTYSTQMSHNTTGQVVNETLGPLQWQQKFDQLGNVTEAAVPGRPAAKFETDSRGALAKETLPDGSSENNFVYHPSGSQANYTDPTSEATSTINDLIGRPVSRTYADGTTEAIEWDGPRVKSVTDRQGRRQGYSYNVKGQLNEVSDAGGVVLDRLTYDSSGRLVSWTNKDVEVTWSNFDMDGNPKTTGQRRFRNESGLSSSPLVLDEYSQEHRWNEHGERTFFSMPVYTGLTLGTGWTKGISETHDAMGNITQITKADAPSAPGVVLMTGNYRNAGRPEVRTVFAGGSIPIVRTYGYDSGSSLMNRMSVTSNGVEVGGSEVAHDGLQKSDARLLGVSGNDRHTKWRYDTRSRLSASVFGVQDPAADPSAPVPGRAKEELTPADFRTAQERMTLLPPATQAALNAKGLDTTAIDPPSLTLDEKAGGGHKIEKVTKGPKVYPFGYAGAEVVDDGRFTYEFDTKGRLIRATEKGPVTPTRRVVYIYSGTGRLVGRRAEYATVANPSPSDFKLEDRASILNADGLPADTTFVWDAISDRLITVARAAATPSDPHGGILKQVIHGGQSYDDPIETAVIDPLAPATVSYLHPIYDEAASGSLQTVINKAGQVVARNLPNDPFGGGDLNLAGAAVDRVAVKGSRESGLRVEVLLRLTEAIAPATLPTGVRLAAVDASGGIVRLSPSAPVLSNPHTAVWTFTESEWNTLVGGAAGISIAATSDLRAAAWSAALPVLPAPAWATESGPIYTSPALPIEVRESLASLSSFLASIDGGEEKTSELYEVDSLALLGTVGGDTQLDDILSARMHAHPFTEPVTQLNYVRARWYDPRSGSFLSPDPNGYEDSSNLYAFCAGDPVNCRDPEGMQARPAPRPPIRPVVRPPAPGQRGPVITAPRTPTPYAPGDWSAFRDAVEAAKAARPKGAGARVFRGRTAEELSPAEQADFLEHRRRLRNDAAYRTQWAKMEKGTLEIQEWLHPLMPVPAMAGGGDDGGDDDRGWTIGDPITNLTRAGRMPAWSTQRGRFWKNEAVKPGAEAKWGVDNVARMKRGLAPQRYNFAKGAMESMELSHEPIPQREGGTAIVPKWPGEHAATDPFRYTGYTKAIVKND